MRKAEFPRPPKFRRAFRGIVGRCVAGREERNSRLGGFTNEPVGVDVETLEAAQRALVRLYDPNLIRKRKAARMGDDR